jgi:hypothetical protein
LCQLQYIGLHHPLDGVTNPKYKLLHFLTTISFDKEKKALAFNQDRCCHLVLCLWLILFHCMGEKLCALPKPIVRKAILLTETSLEHLQLKQKRLKKILRIKKMASE